MTMLDAQSGFRRRVALDEFWYLKGISVLALLVMVAAAVTIGMSLLVGGSIAAWQVHYVQRDLEARALWTIRAIDVERRLDAPLVRRTFSELPAVSADGRRIAWEQNGTLYVEGPGMETPYAIQHAELPAWSPDGENLVYRGASRDLRLLRFDRSGRVQPPVSISGDAFGLARTPVWSSDGNRLAVNALVPLSRSGEEVSGVDFLAHEVFVVDLSDNTMVDISESPFSVDYSPTWGGDAETVVFVSDRDGNPEIYLYNEQRLHRLTNNTVNDYNPLFAPDGRRIAYVSHRADVPQIYILELTDPPESYGPYGVSGRVSGAFFQWSADSTRLIFTALYRGGAQLYMLYLETGRLEPLTDKAHYAILMP